MNQIKNKPLQIRERTIIDGVFFKYILKFIFKLVFKVCGWTSGPAPQTTGVIIGVPHTSNWDFLFGIAAAIIEDVKVYFSIKQSWCRKPVIGPLIMWLGGIPIDRSVQGQGQVEQISRFAEKMKHCWIYFAFTPEGTRGKVEKWKTGFYHVAQDCHLPLHLAKLDYLNKNAGIFHTFTLSGNKENDIKVMQEAYKLIRGCNPEKQFPDYVGPVPEVTPFQAELMRTVYKLENKASLEQLDTTSGRSDFNAELDALVVLGLLERLTDGSDREFYGLSYAGKGCLLHLYPIL